MVYKGVTITANDYQTLEEGEFLNDLVIEFYLTYLKNEVLNKEDRDKVYVFRYVKYNQGYIYFTVFLSHDVGREGLLIWVGKII